MEIKYQFEIVDQHQNSKKPLIDGNKKWVAVESLNSEKIMEILCKVFEKAECCKDTLWYDSNTTLAEMIVIQFEKELSDD